MLHLYDRASFSRALSLDLDPRLHALLADRIGNLTEDLIDYTEYLVVEPGDTEAEIVRHIGLSPLIEPMDGIRFGEPGFRPHWDYLAVHDGWFELIFTFGSTFAYVVFVQDVEGVPAELRKMFRTYTEPRFGNR
jgi:hypothetical protein